MISDVFNMDCLEYMRNIPDKFFDLAIADPPYGIKVTKMTLGKRNGANLKLTDFKGNPNAARNSSFYRYNVFSTGWEYTAPATKIAKARSEKYRAFRKK